MGANSSKLARTGASAAKKSVTAATAAPPPASSPAPPVQSPFPSGVKLPPGWNPNAPRGERRPKVAWETDMSQKPKEETIEFMEREDIKNQILAKDFATRGLHLHERPAAKGLPLTPQDLNRQSASSRLGSASSPNTVTIPILARRKAQEHIQQQAAGSHPSIPVPGLLTLDQLMAVWTAPSEQALAELATKYEIPLVKLQALRKYTNAYHVAEWEGSYVGVWGAAGSPSGPQQQRQAGQEQ